MVIHCVYLLNVATLHQILLGHYQALTQDLTQSLKLSKDMIISLASIIGGYQHTRYLFLFVIGLIHLIFLVSCTDPLSMVTVKFVHTLVIGQVTLYGPSYLFDFLSYAITLSYNLKFCGLLFYVTFVILSISYCLLLLIYSQS